MEAFYVILGGAAIYAIYAIYAIIHSCILSFKNKKRTGYEKFIAIAGWVCVALVVLSVMFGE